MKTILIVSIIYGLLKLIPDCLDLDPATEADIEAAKSKEPGLWHYAVTVAIIIIITSLF